MKTNTVPWDYDRLGNKKAMKDKHRYDAEPFAPYWETLAHDRNDQLKLKLGQELHGQFITALPDEFFDIYSPQQRAMSFERVIKAVNALPLGETPTVEYLLENYRYKREA